MAKEKLNTSFALIAMVAIVAIVAIVMMFTMNNKAAAVKQSELQSAMYVDAEGNLVGQSFYGCVGADPQCCKDTGKELGIRGWCNNLEVCKSCEGMMTRMV